MIRFSPFYRLWNFCWQDKRKKDCTTQPVHTNRPNERGGINCVKLGLHKVHGKLLFFFTRLVKGGWCSVGGITSNIKKICRRCRRDDIHTYLPHKKTMGVVRNGKKAKHWHFYRRRNAKIYRTIRSRSELKFTSNLLGGYLRTSPEKNRVLFLSYLHGYAYLHVLQAYKSIPVKRPCHFTFCSLFLPISFLHLLVFSPFLWLFTVTNHKFSVLSQSSFLYLLRWGGIGKKLSRQEQKKEEVNNLYTHGDEFFVHNKFPLAYKPIRRGARYVLFLLQDLYLLLRYMLPTKYRLVRANVYS